MITEGVNSSALTTGRGAAMSAIALTLQSRRANAGTTDVV
jgi:hypothetical protein